MLTVDRLFNGVILVAPLAIGALITGVLFVGDDGSNLLPISFFQIALGFTILSFVAKKMIKGDLSIDLYGLELLYLLFFGLIFLSIIYTPEREEALFFVFRFMALIVMTYIIYNSISSFDQLTSIIYIILGVALALALYNILQIYLNPEIAAFNYANQGMKLMRSTGGDLDPNIFASNYFFPIIYLIAIFSNEKSVFRRLIIFSIIGVLITSVLLTYSRSSWVSIGIATFIVIYYTKNARIIVYFFVAFLLAFTISDAVRQLTFTFFERFIDIFAGSSDDSSKFRILLAVTAVYIILDSYLMGIGFQGFSTAFKTYHPPETTQGIYQPHNQYYAVFAELGIFGFILFCSILYVIGSTGMHAIQKTRENTTERMISVSLFATFIAYLVFYNFIGGMYYNSILFIVISLIFVINKFLGEDDFNKRQLTT